MAFQIQFVKKFLSQKVNNFDILSQNYYRHIAIHLSYCFKNVSQLIVNGRKSSWANISIS